MSKEQKDAEISGPSPRQTGTTRHEDVISPTGIFTVEDIEIPSTYRRQNDCLLTVLCILATLVFFPIGIFTLYYLYRGKKELTKGNVPQARAYGLYANFLSIIAILCGMVWVGLVIGLSV